MTIEAEVLRLAGVKPAGRRESNQDFLVRVVKALDDVPEKAYNKLSKDAQKWAEEATEAFNNEDEIPEFPETDEADEDEADTDTEETEADEDEAAEEEADAEDDPEEGETEAEEDEDTETETEDEDMPDTQEETSRSRRTAPAKKKAASSSATRTNGGSKVAKSGGAKAGGGLVYARQLLCKNPDMAIQQLVEKMKAKGFAVSTQTLHTTRSGFRQDLKVLQEAGLLKKKLV